ncbi:hypothetical protein H0G86_003611 [Trichoderma simmonsii]|uniref:Uncharacterized protein n=1 Tax=Trichoderma simmonsii TaxID=1491479 RepID=A0A8G0PCP4_9HYPO|nr:hypothetical protein H0G86_003611 [Trichoderma simmonsii]
MQFFPGQKHALAAPFFSPFVRKSELLSYIVAIPKSCRAGKSPIISPSLLFFFPFLFLVPPSASPLFFCLTFTSSLLSPQPQPRTFNFSIKSRSRAAPAPSPKLHPSSLSPAARHSSCCNRCSPASSVHPSGRRASHHPLAQLQPVPFVRLFASPQGQTPAPLVTFPLRLPATHVTSHFLHRSLVELTRFAV